MNKQDKSIEEIKKEFDGRFVFDYYFDGNSTKVQMLGGTKKDDIWSFIETTIKSQREQAVDLSEVNRVEVIDHSIPLEQGGGRAYVKPISDINVTQQLQDEGRTLKVFINLKEQKQ